VPDRLARMHACMVAVRDHAAHARHRHAPRMPHAHPCSVTRTEAERYLEGQAERTKLREEVQQALREKGIDVELPTPTK
jgi:hypothetical protein